MNKKEIFKQALGIDVAKDNFVAALATLDTNMKINTIATKTFKNDIKGVKELITWTEKKALKNIPIAFVMEATGVYHQLLAYALFMKKKMVAVVLPNKIHAFNRSLNINNRTDKTDAKTIAAFALSRNLKPWKPAPKVYVILKKLTREYKQLAFQINIAKNQLHAAENEIFKSITSIERIKQRIKLLQDQRKQILAEIKIILKQKQNDKVKKDVQLLMTIPGVGLITAVTVLAETNAFELITNRRQLASFAGLDVKAKQSGTSVRPHGSISKKGNKYLRTAMYWAALTAIRHSNRYENVYNRIYQRTAVKMKALVAVQRRLLELTFTIYKKYNPYDENYLINNKPKTA